MRILLINHFPLVGSGSGVYVTNIAKSLVQKGHEVCIIMPENSTDIAYIKIRNVKIHPVFFKREEQINGQQNFNFPCMDAHPRSDFLFRNMTESQIQAYERVFRDAIEEEIRTFRPDIIHSQHIWIISGLLKDYHVPYIITSHGAEFITYNQTNRFDSYGFGAINGCKKVIAISNDNLVEILDKFPNAKDKVVLVKNGYNSQDFFVENLDKKCILRKFAINRDFEKIVLFVGRVSRMKGLDTLLRAAKIYETEKTLTLIAGDGDFFEDLNILKEELELKNIVFLGSKKQDELRELYNISDVLVLPSRKEALPLVAIEALACGTPAVVTNQFGMADIINKDVGLTFEMDDEEMLAHKINMVLNEEITFDKNNIANYAKNNYSQEILINKLLSLYEEVKKEEYSVTV